MKKQVIIRVVCIVIILLIAVVIWLAIKENNLTLDDKLLETNTILVTDLRNSDELEIKERDKIDKIIEIILNRTIMPEDEPINYGGFPNYRLKMLDKKEKIITEIDFYCYNVTNGYIILEDEYYKIDVTSLLEIIESK